MKEFSKYLNKMWGWWLALILIIVYWNEAGWWFGFMFIGLHLADILLPEKKNKDKDNSYPYER